MDVVSLMPADLLAIQNLVYNPSGFDYSLPLIEKEGSKYGACAFTLNGLSILFRVAKITPVKIGQFVTIWKRIGSSPIQPFDLSDSVDIFVISVRQENFFGQFIFPKLVLYEKGIVSRNGIGGKRAMRVYPPWDKTISEQARKTQKWQLEYFLEISQNRPIDSLQSHILYGFRKF